MREIKFRYWDMENKKIITDGDVYLVASDCILAGDLANPPVVDITGNVLVSQYTGLKDKNGKEIYEGDIVERYVLAFGETRVFTGEVKEFECAWWIDNGTAAVPLWNEMHELKIIGNIYDNPELISS